MSIYGLMRTSVSGMSAQADRMSAVSDNIANVSTTGYKAASTEFSTLVLDLQSGGYQSGAVEVDTHRGVDQQGALTNTSSNSDLAVKGSGFFVVADSSGQTLLTRAGNFIADSSGDYVNTAGFKLLGYNLDSGNSAGAVNGPAALVPINTSTLALRAVPSTNGTLSANLPATATAVATADLPSTNSASATYTAKTSVQAFGNLGAGEMLDVYFSKVADNSWEVTVYDHAAAASSGGFPYSSGALATATLDFDGTTGAITSGSSGSLTVQVPSGQALTLDLAASTQYATDFVVQKAVVDGNAPVALDRVEISGDGMLTAVYENGARIASYRIPLANVASPDNMFAVSGNAYLPSLASGDMQIGTANTGGLGSINSSTLEQSTVDLASELTDMIEAQRSYGANSKVFQVGSELMDVLINLKR